MKSTFLLSLTLLFSYFTKAQIIQTSIVEHFTNSNCSVCASNNPGIYSTLNSYPNVLHITYHPSSPYASCVFSQLNPMENDARTNFYGVYGSTPRLIVNGSLVTTSSLNTTLSNSSSLTTAFGVNVTQQFINADSVNVSVVIKKVSADTTTNALLFVGAFQDTIFKTTGNGESIHHDVFRKSLSNISGNNIALPVNINDSITLAYAYKIAGTWDASRMRSIAILQASNKKVINAAQSINIISIPLNITPAVPKFENLSTVPNVIFPNPCNDVLNLNAERMYQHIRIVNQLGQQYHFQSLSDISANNVSNTTKVFSFNISKYPKGLYFIELTNKYHQRSVYKLIKE